MTAQMAAKRLVRLAVDHRDDMRGAGERLACRHSTNIVGRRFSGVTTRSAGCAHASERFMHRLEKGRHIFSADPSVRVAQPSSGELGGQRDGIDRIFFHLRLQG